LPGAPTDLGSRVEVSHPDLDAFRPGTSVIHPEFGLGRIVAIDGEGSLRKGRVAFAIGPARTFVLAKSPLRPVTKPKAGGPAAR
jgi:DNA helicase-2/ATP-dependent DNA helicase PcrA